MDKFLLTLFSLFCLSLFSQTIVLDESYLSHERGEDCSQDVGIVPYDALRLPNGEVILAGKYANGEYETGNKYQLAKVDLNGCASPMFRYGAFDAAVVYTLALADDDKFLAGGIFETFEYEPVSSIIRMDYEGNIDTTFKPFSTYRVREIIRQPDGNYLLLGSNNNVPFTNCKGICRIKPDGDIDSTFVGTDFDFTNYKDVRLQSDGKIILGDGGYLKRLNPDGTLDQVFSDKFANGNFHYTYNVCLNDDDEIFITYQTQGIWLEKFTKDGDPDTSFKKVRLTDIPSSMICLGSGDLVLSDSYKIGVYEIGVYGEEKHKEHNYTYISRTGDYAGGVDFDSKGSVPVNPEIFSLVEDTDSSFFVLGETHYASINNVDCNNAYIQYRSGRRDPEFNVPSGISYFTFNLIELPDEKVLIPKKWNVNGFTFRDYLCVMDSTGNIDTTYRSDQTIRTAAAQKDRKFLVAGDFETFNGKGYKNLVRFNMDGTIDESFNPGNGATKNGGAERGSVYNVFVQDDGKILVQGYFNEFDGWQTEKIARLNANGSVDKTFKVSSNYSFSPTNGGMKILSDGSVLVAGNEYDDYPGLICLNPNGTYNESFSDNIGLNHEYEVNEFIVQPDDKIVINTSYAIRRIFPDGNIDESFKQWKIGRDVYAMASTYDGKIVLGGDLETIDGDSVPSIIRLNTDGEIDSTFIMQSDLPRYIYEIFVHNDGDMIVFGWFSQFNGVPRNNLLKLTDLTNDPLVCDLDLGLSVGNLSCSDTSLTITANAYGVKGPVDFSWSGDSINITDTISINSKGVYKAYVIDSIGCMDSASTNVLVPVGVDIIQPEISLVSLNEVRPGRNAKFSLIVGNSSCVHLNGTVQIVLDSNVILSSFQPSYDQLLGDTLVWNLTGVDWTSDGFKVEFEIEPNQTLTIGDTVSIYGVFKSTTGTTDSLFEVEEKTWLFPIVNSYDPNDIKVYPVGHCNEHYIKSNEDLYYTVRFQNTGNASAIDVVVRDTLSNYIDISSLQIINTSHDVILNIVEGNVVDFVFKDINLPDSANFGDLSIGTFTFKVALKNPVNRAVVENNVAIYFDFNPPIFTNTVFNTLINDGNIPICKSVSYSSELINSDVFVYPNPFFTTLNLIADNFLKAEVYDLNGKIVKLARMKHFSLDNIKPGIYFIKVYMQNGAVIKKVVKN